MFDKKDVTLALGYKDGKDAIRTHIDWYFNLLSISVLRYLIKISL